MKKLFFAIAIATVMASCSSDETLDVVAKVPITFGNAFVENSTRAVYLEDNTYTTDNLEKFNVYGKVTGTVGNSTNVVNIFNGDAVTKTEDTNNNVIWDCTKKQYWVPDCTYDFVALAGIVDNNGNVINQVTCSNASDGSMPTKVTYNVATQADLLLATRDPINSNIYNTTDPVEFTFNHLLSKVQFTFTNKFAEGSGVNLKVKDIQISGIHVKGDYNINSNESYKWDNFTDDTTSDTDGYVPVSFGDSEEMVPNGGISTSKYAKVLIPGEYSLKISFTITHELGGQPTPKNILQTITLEAGHSYNFTAELNASNVEGVVPISFTITKDNNWGEEDDKPVDY